MEAMPKHKQAGQTTVLTKMTANIARKRLQCRSHPHTKLTYSADAALQQIKTANSGCSVIRSTECEIMFSSGLRKDLPKSPGQRLICAKCSFGYLDLSSAVIEYPCYYTQRRTGQRPRCADVPNTLFSTKPVLGVDRPSGHEAINLSVIIPNPPKLLL